MATSKAYLQFILEQLSGLDGITYRQMMGEYILYYREKIAAYLCDDRLLIKPVASAVRLMPEAVYEPPYEGAKEMLLCEDVDNSEFLKELFVAIEPELAQPKKKDPLKVKKLTRKDRECALDVAWEVFKEFEAPDYTQEGVGQFRQILDNQGFINALKFYGAFYDNELVGVLAMRVPQHVSLFFVKADYQQKGIGRKLFERMKKDYENKEFTVHSSPYAVEVYKKLGFIPTDTEQCEAGIRYTPMRMG